MKHLRIKINKFEIDGHEILNDIDFVLNEKDKISIVGGNGVGKTTLLRILTGEITDFDGHLDNVGNLKIGYLSQIYSDNEDKLVREELKDAFTEINKMDEELSSLEEEMGNNPENMDLIEKYTEKIDIFNNIGGYNYNNTIHQVASGMGIFELLEKPLTQISGGQRTKVALAKILLEAPDILMLDEPTNFIDLNSVEWLENYLQTKWYGGYIIISHDREFLDKTCDKTYEMWPNRPINFYHTNYSGYLKERAIKEKKALERFERQQEHIEKEEKLINRFRAGSRASMAKSRAKALEKLDRVEKPYIPKTPNFYFDYTEETNERIFHMKEMFVGRQDPLFYIGEINLMKNQRVGIVGENGAGKSTLLKTIMGKIDVLDGMLLKGKGLKISYYSQMHEELDRESTIRQNFEKFGINYPDQQLIGLLHHYLFEKEDIEKKVKYLSGGQTSKLLFAILGQIESNVLILDEPTNHLDYDSREALEKALQKYKGTILFISHDRYFVNKMADNLWLIADGELVLNYGNYEDYKYKKEKGLDFNANLFDEEAQLNLALEDKLGEKEAKRIRQKYGRGKKNRK
ncbi:MAG: ATP-binding cassette domain-containing protein [Candidatus Gracilibacteria bacterium]|nr:ATP-binding cassette domain-containing protein [Candidatus Gracilibacteria bacterium]